MTLYNLNLTNEQNKKTNKRVLNMNAIKFRLYQLHSTNIRYEVIYKNLVRDVRKFYSQDLNESTDFIKRKRKNENSFFEDCLRQYVKEQIGDVHKSMNMTED